MRKTNGKTRESTAFLYERLSRDDNLEGDSYSIQNQKKLLTKVAKEKGYTHLVHFFEKSVIVGIKSRGLLRHKALLV